MKWQPDKAKLHVKFEDKGYRNGFKCKSLSRFERRRTIKTTRQTGRLQQPTPEFSQVIWDKYIHRIFITGKVFLFVKKRIILYCVMLFVAACTPTSTVIRSHHANKTRRAYFSRSTSKRCKALLPDIKWAASKAGVDPALLVGVVRVESNFNPNARSGAGAIGLTQVIPSTAKSKGCGPLYDPRANLLCGARVLKGFLDYYNGNLVLALSGYNAGHYYPDQADRNSTVPRNFSYVEAVLHARSHFLLHGCNW